MNTDTKPVVVFDIDDTLYAEFDYICSGIRQAFTQVDLVCDVEAFIDAYAARFIRGERNELFQNAAADLGEVLEGLKLAAFLSAYRCQQPHISLSSYSAQALTGLKKRGIALAAISDGDAVRQSRKVSALGLRKWLDPIVLTGTLEGEIDKRSPQPFEMIESHFGAGYQFAYVADNSAKDFIHPSQRGWYMIQMQRPKRVHQIPPVSEAILVTDEKSMFAAVNRFVESFGIRTGN